MAGRTIFETERLILREFDEEDVESFYLLGSDPAITRYTGDEGVKDIKHAQEVLRSRPLADYRKYGYGRWACVHKENRRVIGFAGLKFLEDLKEVDIGFRLLPAYWGVGLATEAGRAVLDYGFTQLRLAEIIGLVDLENIASVRVLAKLGLKFVGMTIYQGTNTAKYVVHRPDRP